MVFNIERSEQLLCRLCIPLTFKMQRTATYCARWQLRPDFDARVSVEINYYREVMPQILHSENKQVCPWPPALETAASARMLLCCVSSGKPSSVPGARVLHVKPWMGCWVPLTYNYVKSPIYKINRTWASAPIQQSKEPDLVRVILICQQVSLANRV